MTHEMIQETILEAVNNPSELELRAISMMERIHAFRLSIHDEIAPEECLLEVKGIKFFAKGDVHGIKSKQKQGKTTAILIMMAALLGCNRFAPRAVLDPETQELPHRKVIYFDTEQKVQDTALLYRRVMELAEMTDDAYERLQIYSLRKMDSNELLPTIRAVIEEELPDIVFIDGIVDLTGDFNDIETSQNLIRELMQIATSCDCAIVNVLHTNKDKDDNNMRGHLGTILAQKAGNVLECKKDGPIFTVSSSDARHQEVPSWSFMFAEDSSIVDGDMALRQMQAQTQQDKKDKAEEEKRQREAARREAVLSIINMHRGRVARSTLLTELGDRLSLGRSSCNDILKFLREEGVILESNGYVTIPDLSMFPRP